jgi:hypothetical protein
MLRSCYPRRQILCGYLTVILGCAGKFLEHSFTNRRYAKNFSPQVGRQRNCVISNALELKQFSINVCINSLHNVPGGTEALLPAAGYIPLPFMLFSALVFIFFCRANIFLSGLYEFFLSATRNANISYPLHPHSGYCPFAGWNDWLLTERKWHCGDANF